jgi:hypothetical protein
VWLADRQQAVAAARKQGKLLLVVQLSGDFAQNSAEAVPAKTYRTVALSDPRVAKELTQRFIAVHQHVGEADVLRKLAAAKTQPPRIEYALSYVCLPDLRVLHFIPGFVSSDELLAELTWAEKCYGNLAGVTAADEAAVVRKEHHKAVAKADWPAFERSFKSRWAGESLASGPSTFDLPAAFVAARAAFDLSLAQRLGKSWQRLPAQEALGVLSAHGGLAREMAHLVMCEFPLVPLSDLERPAYEACAKERFWEASRRREMLATWWTASAASGKPLLVVVADDAFTHSANESNALVWPPAKADALPLLAQFAVQTVSLDEFAALATDAKLEPMTYRAAASPRYVLFAAGGKPAALLVKGASLTRLAQAMTAATGTGALAATSAGVPRDGEPSGGVSTDEKP